ncbi:MAG: hypothetical protein K1X89_21025 [Myxococcaceae bacterium]|nr:hypothetical protein [Myxococcaceae bacterium]
MAFVAATLYQTRPSTMRHAWAPTRLLQHRRARLGALLSGAVLATALLAPGVVHGEEPQWIDARVTSTMQLFRQALIPGLPGAVTRVEPAYPFTLSAFTRFGGLSAPLVDGSLSGELSAWGRAGPLDGLLGDGDLSAAWVQYAGERLTVRLGRQVTLPGASRFVRFDGLTLGARVERFDLQAYAGWVALPRWSQPRGAVLAGFAADALVSPALLETQNRAGQLTFGARAQGRWPTALLGVSFHEQRDQSGVAYRVVGVEGSGRLGERVEGAARLTFDLMSLAVSEARVSADVRTPWVPVSLDYVFQSPSLLLPRTSVLAAFGAQAWHELGAETTLTALQSLKLTARAAAQLYEGERPGGRGAFKVAWVPGLDRRTLVVAEAGRALVPQSGLTFVRLGARTRLAETLWLSGDGALYGYDAPVRGQSHSLTGIASLEWSPWPRLRALLSGTAMTTPYSSFELQALARLEVELGTVAEGPTP